MKTAVARLAILLLIIVELAWIVAPRRGAPMIGSAYRNRERIGALSNYASNPSPDNLTAVQKEMDLLEKPAGAGVLALYTAVFLIFNGGLFFLFWKIGESSKTSPDSSSSR